MSVIATRHKIKVLSCFLLSIFIFSNMEKKTREIMPVKTVTSPRSAPQGTFRQATRGVSKENEFEANFLVHAYLHFSTPCLVK